MIPNGIDMYHGDNHDDDGLSDVDLTAKFAQIYQSGIFWIMHKVTQGVTIIDPKFQRRRACAKAAGFKFFGGYHFLSVDDPIAQAKFFLENCHDDGVMCFAADFEKPSKNPNTWPALHQLKTFMQYVDANTNTARCKIYGSDLIREVLKPPTGGHIAPNMQDAIDFFHMPDLWLAEYGPHENAPWPWTRERVWAWQYSDDGHIAPLFGKLDLNFFAGSEHDLSYRWRI
jgi:GH25 family lysozyme M1 (1,4-beta-N-acetylmuramidase)